MTDKPPRESRTGVWQALAPVRGWTLVQSLAVVAAAAFAINAARLLNEPPHSREPFFPNFDQAMLWLGLALLATLVVAWRPSIPKLAVDRAALRSWARAHWREATLFALILGFGIFMRTYQFGGLLPPSDGLCCEEHINGGVAYLALEGDRPVQKALVRWASAGGFFLFGETTLGLRFFFPVLSVATLVLFYFLLRRLVSIPVALFGLALYSAAWWPSLRARQTTEGTVYAVLLALLIVRGLQTRSPLAFLGAGIVAGLISYEYESYRFVPMIAGGFLVAAAAREVLLRRPLDLPAA
ncbi:MAG: glycosyltransferase family 39 protein, partial [Dehalococcoidia bacterium]